MLFYTAGQKLISRARNECSWR